MAWVPFLPFSGDAVDAGLADAVLGQGVAAVATVVGLDPADGRDQLPRDVAGLVGGVDDLRAALVGGEGGGGDAVAGGAGDDRVRGALGDGGGDRARHGHAGRGLDRVAGDAWCRRGGAAVESSNALALVLTRLAVHTPERSASGTRVIALLRRDNGLRHVCALSLGLKGVADPPTQPTRPFNEPSPSGSRANPRCDRCHSPGRPRRPRGAAPFRLARKPPVGRFGPTFRARLPGRW